MKLGHQSVLTPAILVLVLVCASAQAKTFNPLVGKWSGRMGDMPTLIQYKPDGTEVLTTMGGKSPYIVNGRYQIRGNTLIQTTVGMTMGGKMTTFAKSNQATQTCHFRVSHRKLMILQPDGSVFTLNKMP